MSSSDSNTDKIEVYENISDNVKTFNNKEEFMNYYETHKSEIDSMKTRGLNMKYTIPGFKIGKRANKITLYPIKDKKEDQDEFQKLHNEISQKLDIIYTLIDEIRNKVVITEPAQDMNKNIFSSQGKEYKNKMNPWG